MQVYDSCVCVICHWHQWPRSLCNFQTRLNKDSHCTQSGTQTSTNVLRIYPCEFSRPRHCCYGVQASLLATTISGLISLWYILTHWEQCMLAGLLLPNYAWVCTPYQLSFGMENSLANIRKAFGASQASQIEWKHNIQNAICRNHHW